MQNQVELHRKLSPLFISKHYQNTAYERKTETSEKSNIIQTNDLLQVLEWMNKIL